MKRTIETKMMLTKVANQMTAAIKEAMAIFSEPAEVEKCHDRGESVDVVVYNKNTYLLTLAEVERIQKTVEPFMRVYGENIFCIFDTQPIILNLGMVHVPSMQFTIHMNKN